jgi:hypothetical protein
VGIGKKVMPVTKTPVKKTAKTAKKPASKTVKKVTRDEFWAGMDELRKLHAETEKTLNKFLHDFVIEPSGEDVQITKPVSDPKVW